MRKFGQTNVLTGKVAGTKELRRTVYKEQNGVRPMWARLASEISEFRAGLRKNLKGEKTSVTKIPEMGSEAVASSQLPVASRYERANHGGTLRLRSEAGFGQAEKNKQATTDLHG